MALAHSHNNSCDSTHSHTSSVLCYNHFLPSNAFFSCPLYPLRRWSVYLIPDLFKLYLRIFRFTA